jgi:hypothetical protein
MMRPGNPAALTALNEVESFASVQSMPPRYTIPGRALFGDEILEILEGFDAYARAELAKGSRPSVARFHSLHGAELKFSERSLLRWLDLRRRHGQRRED